MAGERQDSTWVIRPSVWFDAVCLVPLLAGLPFYTSRHEQDARWWPAETDAQGRRRRMRTANRLPVAAEDGLQDQESRPVPGHARRAREPWSCCRGKLSI